MYAEIHETFRKNYYKSLLFFRIRSNDEIIKEESEIEVVEM